MVPSRTFGKTLFDSGGLPLEPAFWGAFFWNEVESQIDVPQVEAQQKAETRIDLPHVETKNKDETHGDLSHVQAEERIESQKGIHHHEASRETPVIDQPNIQEKYGAAQDESVAVKERQVPGFSQNINTEHSLDKVEKQSESKTYRETGEGVQVTQEQNQVKLVPGEGEMKTVPQHLAAEDRPEVLDSNFFYFLFLAS